MGRLYHDFALGQRFETPARTVTQADIGAFAGLTGDYNPVHTDEVFASATEFGGRVAHGPMGIGMAFGLMSRLDLIDGTVVALLGVQWAFTGPVRPGDTIRALVEVREMRPTRREDRGIVTLAIDLHNQRDERVQEGEARLLMRRMPHPGAAWGLRQSPPIDRSPIEGDGVTAPAGATDIADAAPERDAARQILDAAARLLRHRGYEATTTRAIAEAVGMKAGSIYHHFPSKDEIVARVVNDGVRFVLDAVVDALAALPQGADAGIRLESAVRAHLLASLQHSDYTSASIRAFAFLPPIARARCRDERRDYERVWREVVADLVAARLVAPGLSQDALRLMLLGAVNWAGEWYRPGRIPIDEIARDFAAAVLRQ